MSQPPAAGTAQAQQSVDWRSSVAQATRSAEVRVVADMLAKMEPGATSSSKLMLAMRFEDEIFNKATSLADYQKRIQKRLKKFTKNYKATAPSPIPTSNTTSERLLELKRKYRERLLFIYNNADTAIQVIVKKKELEKAKSLKQHTDNAKEWATNLGVLPGTSPNTGMNVTAINDMQALLERRIDNIRSHLLKLANLDLLLEETLDKLEHDLSENASQLLAAATSRRLARLGWSDFDDPLKALQENLQKAQEPIPPPTRNKNSLRNAALQQLERMRSASQAVLAFLAVANKQTTGVPQDVLRKCHTASMTTLDFIAQVIPELVDSAKVAEKDKVETLQDAWTKVLEFPTTTDESSLAHPAAKRIKTTTPTGIRSRVLLTPGRKTPPNVLPELVRKGARLVRPPPSGQGSHLIVDFGSNAFVMTIYLVPLLVTIRASTTNGDATATTAAEPSSMSTVSNDNDNDKDCTAACWTPLQAGLDPQQDLQIWGVTGSPAMLGQVVQGQLDYASARATAVLRKYFASTASATNDFEVEISEASALLQFLALVRTTYTPNYEEQQDVVKVE